MDTGADTASPTLTSSRGPRRATGGSCRLRGVLRQRLRVRELGLAHSAGARRPRAGPGRPRPGAAGHRGRVRVIALPVAGMVVTRLGAGAHHPRRCRCCWPSASRPSRSGTRTACRRSSSGCSCVGFGNGTWDVAMNVEGAAVEQHHGRSIMPRFHAGFSVGTVAGALVGLGDGRPARRRRPPTSPRSRWSSRSAVPICGARASCPRSRTEHAAAQPGRAPPADGLDRAAHAADRAVRARHGVHRGHRQRLARRRGHRRLRRRAGRRLADVRGLRRRDDRRAAGSAPPCSTASGACPCCASRRSPRWSACCWSSSARRCRWPWPVPCCGGSAPRSASPSA